jgi:hypothetical protein
MSKAMNWIDTYTDCDVVWFVAPVSKSVHTRQLDLADAGKRRSRQYGGGRRPYRLPIIALRASARAISTKAEVTSGPPTRIRVGVFILFHS